MGMHLLQSFKEKNKEKSWKSLKFKGNGICTFFCKGKHGEMAAYFNYKQVANVIAFKIFSEEIYDVPCSAHILDKPKVSLYITADPWILLDTNLVLSQSCLFFDVYKI